MLDNELIFNLRSVLIAGLATRNVTGVAVKQAFQPTQQGADTNAAIYFYKLSDHRLGYPTMRPRYDTIDAVEKVDEHQNYETTFQIEAWVRQVPTSVVDYIELTASDLVNIAASILQSRATIKALFTAKIGLYRITDIRNPYFLDDRDQFEASPSFDVVLTHTQGVTSETDSTDIVKFNVYRVD